MQLSILFGILNTNFPLDKYEKTTVVYFHDFIDAKLNCPIFYGWSCEQEYQS